MVDEKHWPLHSSEKSPMYRLSLWSLTPLVQCILITFINRLRWDAYLHMYMLFLVENFYKNSFFTTCGNQFSCYSIRRIFGTLPLSPQQFLLRLYIVGHSYFVIQRVWLRYKDPWYWASTVLKVSFWLTETDGKRISHHSWRWSLKSLILDTGQGVCLLP